MIARHIGYVNIYTLHKNYILTLCNFYFIYVLTHTYIRDNIYLTTKTTTAHKAERNYKMKALVKTLVSELNNLEISYSLDVASDIKEACSSLDIEPNEHIAEIKEAYLHCTGEELSISHFTTQEEETSKLDYMMCSRLKMDLDYYLNNQFEERLLDTLTNLKDYYKKLPEVPEWLTREQLAEYEKKVATAIGCIG